jgi:hypothetical protein
MLSRQRFGLITLAVSVGLFATQTVAQVVITQAKANAGNVTPGDTQGYPVTISQPGSYKLGSNLAVPAGKDGIVINNFDVTINFNGFRMHVSGAALNGIVGNFDTTTIKNGVIAGFTGNAILGMSYWTVENMKILVNGGDGIRLANSSFVKNSIVNRNIGYGVFCEHECLVEGNVITRNGHGDILQLRGVTMRSGTVLGNTIANNRASGIESLSGPVGAGNNTFFGNANGGTQVFGVTRLQPNTCVPATGC